MISIDCFNNSSQKWHGTDGQEKEAKNDHLRHVKSNNHRGSWKAQIDVVITTAQTGHKINYQQSVQVQGGALGALRASVQRKIEKH